MKNSKTFFLGFLLSLPLAFSASHLPQSLMNALRTVELYAIMTSIWNVPVYSIITMFSPTYFFVSALIIPLSILYFTKRQNLIFFVMFLLTNYFTYFFQTGWIGIMYAWYGTSIVWVGILSLLASSLLLFDATRKKRSIQKLVPWALGVGMGMFYFPLPRTIERAFELTLGTYAYVPKFFFSLKILLFIGLQLFLLGLFIHIVLAQKYLWAKRTIEFIKKHKRKITRVCSASLLVLTIVIYTFRYGML